MTSQAPIVDQRLEALSNRIEALETAADAGTQAAMEHKLDLLLEHMREQQLRQLERDELRQDLVPIANQFIKLSIDELAEIGSDFKLEDALYLLKRLMRDTHLLVGMLQRLESAVDLIDETKGVSLQVFHQLIVRLDEFERKGYFKFASEGGKIIDRIVTEFTEEDVEALGENIVTILKTIRSLTQPELMALTSNAASAIREMPPPQATPSAWALMRELSDPQVRKGLARLVGLVKVFAEETDPTQDSRN